MIVITTPFGKVRNRNYLSVVWLSVDRSSQQASESIRRRTREANGYSQQRRKEFKYELSVFAFRTCVLFVQRLDVEKRRNGGALGQCMPVAIAHLAANRLQCQGKWNERRLQEAGGREVTPDDRASSAPWSLQ